MLLRSYIASEIFRNHRNRSRSIYHGVHHTSGVLVGFGRRTLCGQDPTASFTTCSGCIRPESDEAGALPNRNAHALVADPKE